MEVASKVLCHLHIESAEEEEEEEGLVSLSLAFPIFFFFGATLHGMWDLSSLTRDRTLAPCSGSPES